MRRDRGAATAELVMVLPVLVAVVLGLTWLLSLGVAEVRTVDAARETARALARGDDATTAIARGERAGPAGTSVVVSQGAGQVRATAISQVSGPGGLFAFLPAVRLHAVAVAATEDGG